ncbi:MAG: molybdopterin-guanine dinucleotide biosynthesis protein B [Chloroflexi bacterium]|jgi:molybdopterin-guanine dinucleotide biosynthesis protein MobB|nr:molybdopterin-guanine dinucleotide biosynthesis protein B [Chloroflexota bacterium]
MSNSDNATAIVAFVGRSGAGKTTLLERVIAALDARGVRVAVVKHTHHTGLATDLPGTDSRRLWEAGAQHTTLWAPDRVAHTHRTASPPTLAMVLRDIHDVDVILVEGDKRGDLPKIEVVRAAVDPALLDLEGRIACVTDAPALAWDGPRFSFDDAGIAALADFIQSTVMNKPF